MNGSSRADLEIARLVGKWMGFEILYRVKLMQDDDTVSGDEAIRYAVYSIIDEVTMKARKEYPSAFSDKELRDLRRKTIMETVNKKQDTPRLRAKSRKVAKRSRVR